VSTDFALPGPDMPVIDESRLMAEFGGDREILAELRDLFLEHAPPLFEAIKQAIADQDITVIARDGHSLKGACATYGAPRLTMVCKVMELAAKGDDWSTINDYRDIFAEEYDKVFEAIGSLTVS
jgi:HPt (histidine-containing phosphotransfer) domain-containing protein